MLLLLVTTTRLHTCITLTSVRVRWGGRYFGIASYFRYLDHTEWLTMPGYAFGSCPLCFLNKALCSYSTFFSISMATHAIACEVCVTRAHEFYNTHHSSHKSTPLAKENIPITENNNAQLRMGFVTTFVGSVKCNAITISRECHVTLGVRQGCN